MISNLIGSSVSLMAFSLTDFLALILNPIALITALFYTLSLLVNSLIYPLASHAYTLFPIMCGLNFSSLIGTLQSVINRLEVFIGIFMLFVVAFNILQYIVDPDKKEGATSKLFTKIIVALALLVSSSFIFGILDDLQTALVDRTKDNIARTVLFGQSQSDSSDLETGRKIVYAVFFSMYENQKYVDSSGNNSEYQALVNGDSFFTVIGHLWDTPSTYSMVRYQYPFLAEVFGIFLIIVFGTFAIDIGVRNFTLLFLRIIFPIAAIGYITPKGEGILSKYISTYISTYVQIFIKTFTIYLLLYIFMWFMQILNSDTSSIFNNMTLSDTTKTIVLLIVLVALFRFFTNGLPAILKNVFGVQMDSSLKGAFGKALGLAAAGVGLAAGGIIGGIKGAGAAGAKGALSGAWSGIKGGATAGNNVGKNFNSGKLGSVVTGLNRDIRSTHTSINKSTSDSVNKITQKAQDDEKAYESAQQELTTQQAILNEMKQKGASDESIRVQTQKVESISKKAADLQGKAQESAQEAKRVDTKYVSSAEKKATDAEQVAKDRALAADAAEKRVQSIKDVYGESSPEYRIAVGEAKTARDSADKAQDNAEKLAIEATKWNSDYNSPALVSAKSKEIKDVSQPASTSTQTISQEQNNVRENVQQTSNQNETPAQPVVQERNTIQTVSGSMPTEQQNVNQTPVQPNVQEHSNVQSVEQPVFSNQTERQFTQETRANANNIDNGSYVGNTGSASTNNVANNNQNVSPVNNQKTDEPVVIIRNANEAINQNNSERNINDSNKSLNKEIPGYESPRMPEEKGNNNSNYVEREDADKNATDGLNENIKDNNVSRIRSYLGSDLKDDKTEEDDSDKRAHAGGNRTTRRIQELMNAGMNALDASNKAYMEADSIINTRAQELINNGVNPERAIQEARREYEEGRI